MARPFPAIIALVLAVAASPATAQHFSVTFPSALSAIPLAGRVLVMISADTTGEPRLQASDAATTAQVFGVDVDGGRATLSEQEYSLTAATIMWR